MKRKEKLIYGKYTQDEWDSFTERMCDCINDYEKFGKHRAIGIPVQTLRYSNC